MNLILFVGIQATGKSSFYRERFFHTHVRINLDMLRTRHRETLLYNACLEGKANVVIDKTNLTRADRNRYIAPAKIAGFTIDCYFFESRSAIAVARNAARAEAERVPELAVRGAARQLELPSRDEGFGQMYFVRLADSGGFSVEEWRDEV